MPSLIPTENWEYNLLDLFSSLNRVLFNKNETKTINIEKIGTCIPIRSGRAAIVAALWALELKSAARIAVPLYSCPAVFKAVTKAGFTLVFVDIEKDTFCMSAQDLAQKSDQVDAVIAIHMFGNLCDMNALIESSHGKFIIEDCAQSLGSEINGRMSGTLGTIGIFSFRSGKYLSVGEGGALYSSDPDIMARLKLIVSDMQIPTKTMEMKHTAKTYVRTKLRTRPLFGLLGKKIWKIYNKTVDYSTKTPIILSTIFHHDLGLTNKRLGNFDKVIEIQRMNADYYSNTLDLKSDMLCFEKPDTFYNRYAYPIIFSSTEQRDAMADYLLKKKIDTIKPYQDIAEVASEHYGYSGDCPVAEKVSKTTLILPSYYRLKKHEIFYIAKCFNEGWSEITTRH